MSIAWITALRGPFPQITTILFHDSLIIQCESAFAAFCVWAASSPFVEP